MSAATRIFYRTSSVYQDDDEFRTSKEKVKPETNNNNNRIQEYILYGLVNSVMSIPALYGYAAIIFRAHAFKTNEAALAKLVLFSSIIHQTIFCLKSSLPFAIGQVQDAGLIFLSTMATAISVHLTEKDAIPTTLFVLSLSTFSLGISVYIIGELKLATLISYLPMPVIGGYLAFIGFFCLQAGLTLCTGIEVSKYSDFLLLINWDSLTLAFPGIFFGFLLSYVSARSTVWYSLPVCILIIPSSFYIYMLIFEMSFEDARRDGWMSSDTSSTTPSHVFSMFNFYDLDLTVIPSLLLTWLSMTFVVAFSSSLDVVAIEMDMKKQLDINHELKTVGLSNIASGLTGGFTGSYIFSQTIFTYRSNASSRIVGIVVIVCELVLFLLPYNILAYIPSYFFAATLIFIAFDLCLEWLLLVYFKVSFKEYLVLLLTFLYISCTNELIIGIAVGIGLSVFNFIICYASVSHVQIIKKGKSNVVRNLRARDFLKEHSQDILVIALHGYLFFGSTVQLVRKIRNALEKVADNLDESDKQAGDNAVLSDVNTPLLASNYVNKMSSTKYIVVDFTRVTGIDASAVSSGLMRLKQMLSDNNLRVCFVNLSSSFEKILVENGVLDVNPDGLLSNSIFVLNDVNDAFAWAEDEIIRTSHDSLDVKKDLNIIQFESLDVPEMAKQMSVFEPNLINYPALSGQLTKMLEYCLFDSQVNLVHLTTRFNVAFVSSGDILFDIGDNSDFLIFLQTGELGLVLTKDSTKLEEELNRKESVFAVNERLNKYRRDTEYGLFDNRHYLDCVEQTEGARGSLDMYVQRMMKNDLVLLRRYDAGSIVDGRSFFTAEKRKYACFAIADCIVFFIKRKEYANLVKHHPSEAIFLNKFIFHNMKITI